MSTLNPIDSIFNDGSQSDKETMNIISLLVQTGIFLAIGVGIFLVFLLLRPKNSAVYARKFKEVSSLNSPDVIAPPKLSKNIFIWIKQFFQISPEVQLQVIGVDGYLFLRFLRLCTIQLSIMCFFGLSTILPINFFNGNNTYVTSNPNNFNILYITLFHITKVEMFWVHVLFAYIYTLVFIYLIYIELRHFVKIKLAYYASPKYQNMISSRSLYLSNVPKPLQNDNSISHFMAKLLPDTPPDNSNFVRLMGNLPKLVDEHEKLVRKLERIMQNYLLKPDARNNTNRPKKKTKDGAMVDAIDFYTKELANLEIAIKVARERISVFKPTHIGFVSYSDPYVCHKADKSLQSIPKSEKKGILFSLAPEPGDIIWNNVFISKESRVVRLWLSRLITLLFCLISFIPSSALTFILDISNLKFYFPSTVSFFNNNQFITKVWQYCFLPLLLVIYYYYIPPFFRFISNYQGITTSTAIERSVCKKMYIFYMITNIFVFTIVGIIFSLANKTDQFGDAIINYPTRIINQINIKNQFWTSYVLLKALTSVVEILQIVSLFRIFFKRYSRFLTPRELKDLISPPVFDIAPSYALYLWIFTICMVYCVYAPITLPYGLACFLIANFVFKYNLLYVYKSRFETGGRMFKIAINRLVFALVAFQLYLWYGLRVRLAQFSASNTVSHAVIPLPIISVISTVALSIWSSRKSDYLTGLANFNPGEDSGNGEHSRGDGETLGESYLHPVLNSELSHPVVMKKLEPLLATIYKGKIGSLDPTVKPHGLEVLPHSDYYSQSIDGSSYELPVLQKQDLSTQQTAMRSDPVYDMEKHNGSNANLLGDSPRYSFSKESRSNSPIYHNYRVNRFGNSIDENNGFNQHQFSQSPPLTPGSKNLDDYNLSHYVASQKNYYDNDFGHPYYNNNNVYDSHNQHGFNGYSQDRSMYPNTTNNQVNPANPPVSHSQAVNGVQYYNNQVDVSYDPRTGYTVETEISELDETDVGMYHPGSFGQAGLGGSDPRMNYGNPMGNSDNNQLYPDYRANYSNSNPQTGIQPVSPSYASSNRGNGIYPGDSHFTGSSAYSKNQSNGSITRPQKLNRK
ncbi:hypothetical protein AYI68_g6909 [Smittium mucronatum]|uniref:Calcium permeable stress-gated cation channel 1 n=1 Tax=Smittium mucronatum TaxID=133383 RepID=A0A1R0GQ60_9FUNG|nr:hypothetical protein AYI68_g6909 [Smittium mucronatum]